MLGHDTRSFLTVVRSLGRHGVEVHVAWCPAESPAAHSRYIAASHDLPAPVGSDERWQQAMLDLLVRERFDLVLPTDDPTRIPLQRHRARFEPVARIYLLDDRAFEVTFDKIKTRALAESLEVPVPTGTVVGGLEDLDQALEGFSLPVVIKPRSSFSLDDLEAGRLHVRKAWSMAEARAAARELLSRGEVVVEENFRGLGIGVELLAAEGEVLLAFQHERVHEPMQGGQSSYRRSVRLDPRIGDAAARLLRALDYTGVAMMEVRLDPDTARWALIEINGRFWGSLPLAVAAGADFPAALWDLLVNGRKRFPASYREHVFARNLRSDLKWLWSNARADRSDIDLASRPWTEVLREAANLARGQEHSDTFARDDLAPGIVELKQLGAAARVAVFRALRASAHRIPGVRRRARLAARRALAADRVLFVCNGNLHRSPFAARWAAARVRSGRETTSAGLISLEGRATGRLPRAVAQEFDVSLEDHRSVLVRAEMASCADAIFVFDEDDHAQLVRRFGWLRGRIHFLGALSERGPLFVSDPVGGNEQVFRSTYETIAELLDGAA